MMIEHKAHPWHGIELGPNCPDELRVFIEIVPTDTVKYEVDKKSGYLSLDRPQKFSNIVPSLYGFIPRTYCGDKMARFTNEAVARYDVQGDGDPLDVCVLTEKDVTHGDPKKRMQFVNLYDAATAKQIINASIDDYKDYISSQEK